MLQTRWRQTTIRTRNGEVIVVPNSQLMKGKFTLFGRADVANWPWRRWVWFNVTYASSPAAVIQKVEKAINGAEIPNVLCEPLATCVLMEFGAGYGRYALRYWAGGPCGVATGFARASGACAVAAGAGQPGRRAGGA